MIIAIAIWIILVILTIMFFMGAHEEERLSTEIIINKEEVNNEI